MNNSSYGTKHSTYKKWGIWYNGETFYAFLPGESPSFMDGPEWYDDSLEALKSFIRSY